LKGNAMKKYLFSFYVAAIFILASVYDASIAQVAIPPPSETVISLGTYVGQFLLWVAAAFSVVIGTVVTALLLKLLKLTGVQVTGAMKEQLEKTVVDGINASAANVAERLRGQGTLVIKNAVVADAVKYAQEHASEAIKGLGLDPNSGAAVATIKATIETAIVDPEKPTPPAITPQQTFVTPQRRPEVPERA